MNGQYLEAGAWHPPFPPCVMRDKATQSSAPALRQGFLQSQATFLPWQSKAVLGLRWGLSVLDYGRPKAGQGP